MANITLPDIKKSLDFNDGSLQWVLTAYSIMYGGFLMAGGRLCDVFEQKVMLFAGMTLFNASTLMCALAQNQITLIIGRGIQGFAAAATIPAAQSLVSLSFEDPTARIKAFGVWGASGSLGFVINSDKHKNRFSNLHVRLDVLGTALSVAGLVLLVYSLTTGNVDGWDKANVLSTLIVGVVCLAIFIYVETKVASDPILPKYIWGDKTRTLGCLGATLVFAIWQGSNYLLTLQLQDKDDIDQTRLGFGFSTLSTSLRFLPLGITAIVVNAIIPSLLKPVGPRNLLFASWLIALAGMVLLSRMESADDYWRYCLPGMIFYISGIGTVYFVGNVTVVATASKETQGTVSGVYNMFLNVGGAVLGVALLTLVSNTVTSSNGGESSSSARLDGYRAGYYTCVGMSALGFAMSAGFGGKKAEKTEETQTSSEGSGSN
ncbi:aminotriazole resistance protein [Fusarium acuminatum]|uniref:Aminotriazole resistance protein n=1 Tax=Fusarium acuminatum TaxID=5515 RepID=A0ABZ2X977_9HYPO